ncbi:PIG-L family deacetylase [Listeria booriae]|uniref:PIG-L family deacetylase n=1 Tax=Listeria booriae TaxID=1552123 RepID=A0A842AVV5_9LIST|nr:PIG-L deacetylase family protein [Listeria booriae]MBC1796863.1 PIG-L family deacetylase [Listeria booriae]
MKRILLITAHSDDAEISMGGTLRKLINQGAEVLNVIFAIPSNIETRKKEAIQSADCFGYDVQFASFCEGNHVEDIPYASLIKEIDTIIACFNPDDVFTHWSGDSHQDHRKLSKAVRSSFRKKQVSLYEFEQINQNNNIAANQFHPNIYTDITETMSDKLNMIKYFESQLQGDMSHYLSHATYIGSWRGAQINTKYAETFLLVFSKQQF